MSLSATISKTKRRESMLARSVSAWFLAGVMLLASVAQAAHMHGGLVRPSKAPHAAAVSAEDGNADTCPLCVAMHSANPATIESEYSKTHVSAFLRVAEIDDVFVAPVAYTHFSRPPPLS
jgi:hypothetical protein